MGKKKDNTMLLVLLAAGGIGLYLYLKKAQGGTALPAAGGGGGVSTFSQTDKAAAVSALSSLLPGDSAFLAALNSLPSDQVVAVYAWNASGRPVASIVPGSALQAALRTFHAGGNYFVDSNVTPYL